LFLLSCSCNSFFCLTTFCPFTLFPCVTISLFLLLLSLGMQILQNPCNLGIKWRPMPRGSCYTDSNLVAWATWQRAQHGSALQCTLTGRKAVLRAFSGQHLNRMATDITSSAGPSVALYHCVM
jgi:hypothetical protein